MRINFDHQPHPRIAARVRAGPPMTTDEHVGINGRIALALTAAVGTMWCAYAFAILALIVLPEAIGGGLLPFVQWVSQTFIQLVMLSVIVVGQNILARASDKRAVMTYRDAEGRSMRPARSRSTWRRRMRRSTPCSRRSRHLTRRTGAHEAAGNPLPGLAARGRKNGEDLPGD